MARSTPKRTTPAAAPPVVDPWLLRVVVFVCGAVLMGLEIVGSRVLAPTFGNSIYVWGSLIGVFMAALSTGYWLGGRVADRAPRFPVLCGLVAGAGLATFVLPFVSPWTNGAIAATALGPRVESLLAATVLFFLPAVLMGAISPFAVRLEAAALASVGTTAGVLYAISTVGSILGTLVTAFILIGLVGVASIVHGLGVTLMGLSAAGLAAHRRRGAGAAVALAAAGLGVLGWAAATYGARDPVIILERDTPYHHVTLREKDRSRFMDFDQIRQSGIALDYPLELRLRYPRVQSLALAFHPDPRRVLAIGVAAGSVPRRLHADWPEATIDAVDIDPEVIALAEQYFGLVPDARLRVHAGDGRRFLQEGSTRYDLVFLDAYNGDNVPFHLTTREFYRELRARMDDDALLVSNVVGRWGPGHRYVPAMLRTIADTFPVVQMIPINTVKPDVDMNFIVVARASGERWSAEELRAAVARLDGRMVPRAELEGYATLLMEPLPSFADAPLLTDDFAPVELLRAR